MTDKPYPSLLIFGKTNVGRPLRTVCSYNENEEVAILITVYQPNPDLWIDQKRRISEWTALFVMEKRLKEQRSEKRLKLVMIYNITP